MNKKRKESVFPILTRRILLNERNSESKSGCQQISAFRFSMRRSINNISSVYMLTAMSFFRNGGAGFFILFFPLLLIMITGAIFSTGQGQASPLSANIIIAGISVSAITGSGLNGLSIRMTQWKQSTIIRRIGCMPLKKIDFLTGVILFYFSLMCFQAIYVLFLGYLLSLGSAHVLGHFNPSFNSGFLLGGWFLTMFFSLSLGVFLSSLTRDPNTNSLFGIMIFLPAAFLSGQYVPLSVIDQRHGLKVASQIWPQRYLVFMIQRGFAPSHHLYNSSGQISDPSWYLYILYPLSVALLVLALATKLFKWES